MFYKYSFIIIKPRLIYLIYEKILFLVPPHVSIVNTVLNSSINTTLECVAHGVPDSYSYNSWVHLTNNRSVVRHLASANKVSVLSNSYEDSGIYICNVSNGVIDDNGNEWTTAEYYMNYSGTMYVIGIRLNILNSLHYYNP